MTTYPQGFRTRPDPFLLDGGPFLSMNDWIIIDPNGNGDFLSLDDAQIAGYPAGSTLYVTDSYVHNGQLLIFAQHTNVILGQGYTLLRSGL